MQQHTTLRAGREVLAGPGYPGCAEGGSPKGTASALRASAVGLSDTSYLTAEGCGSPLGTVARFSSASVGGVGAGVLSPRVRRFMLQAGARELLPDERVAHCLRTPIGGHVDVLYSPKHCVGHLGGLQTCGSVWACPVCQAKISERRAEELQAAVSAWSGQLLLVTLTLQHSAADPLGQLLDDLLEASYALRNGRWWVAFKGRHGLAGTVRSLEVTDGSFGWHPHLHVLFFVAASADVDRFTVELRERWQGAVAKQERYTSPRWGIDVRSANEEIAAYVAKFGREQYWTVARELAKSSSKNAYGSGRSMGELLEAYVVEGDQRAGLRWREYALTFKGRKQHVYSRGLRALLGLVVEEKSDEEVAAEAIEDAVVLARLDLSAWRVVLANDARGELCDVASSGDPVAVRSFLESLGVILHEGVRSG